MFRPARGDDLFAGGHAILRVSGSGTKWGWFVGSGFLIVVLGAALMLFYRTPYYNWGKCPDAQLDERERRTRNHYFRVAFNAYASIVTHPWPWTRAGRVTRYFGIDIGQVFGLNLP